MQQYWCSYFPVYQAQPSSAYTLYFTDLAQIQPSCQIFFSPVSNQGQNTNKNESQIDSRPEQTRITVPLIEKLKNLEKKSSRKYWSASEDKKLINIFQKFPKEWNKISNNIEGRNQAMCYSRYRRITQGRKKYWTQEVDKKIIQKVKQYGFKWKKISNQIPDKSPKQIRERYLSFLRQDISKQDWTLQQDIKICELVQLLGHRWKKFEQFLKGRTQNQIKARYYGHIKRIIQTQGLNLKDNR